MRLEIEAAFAVAVPEGDHVDASNKEAFKEALEAAAEAAAGKPILLDLSSVRFVDSSGLGAVMAVLRKLRGEGRDMAACGVSANVLVLFDLVRLDRVMRVFPDRASAAAAFPGR